MLKYQIKSDATIFRWQIFQFLFSSSLKNSQSNSSSQFDKKRSFFIHSVKHVCFVAKSEMHKSYIFKRQKKLYLSQLNTFFLVMWVSVKKVFAFGEKKENRIKKLNVSIWWKNRVEQQHRYMHILCYVLWEVPPSKRKQEQMLSKKYFKTFR